MKNKIISIALLGLSALGFAQTPNNQTILTVKDEAVSVDNFVYIYNKNNSRDSLAYSQESLNDYMELFIKYKLKVKEAESRQMDTLPAFINEFETYRNQLKKPYLTAKGFEEKLVKDAYERVKTYVNTSHILIQVDEFASPADTLKAYNKILDIRNQILNGADFGEMAIQHSEDPSSKDPRYIKGYKGYLGFNAAFSLVYPYEKAAIDTKVGEISNPVKTRFGYHLIKVNDKKENTGKVSVAHIMIEARDGITAEDSITKRKLALELYDNLMKDANWDQLCKDFSIDKRTSEKGGVLPPFSRYESKNLPESFENTAFSLENIGDISKPIKTSYGWHIIKLVEKTPIASFEDMKHDLSKKVKSSSLFGQNRAELVKDLKVENQFNLHKKAYSLARKYADTTLSNGNWIIPSKYKSKKKLFSIKEQEYTLKEFFTYLAANQENIIKTSSPTYTMDLALNKYIDDCNYIYEETHLEEKYQDYRMLVQEYRDGILLFDLMKEEVWDKASKDTTGIKEYYNNNKSKYPSKSAVKAKIYKSPKEETLDLVINSIKKDSTDNSLIKTFNQSSQLNLQIEKNEYEKGDNVVIDSIDQTSKTHKLVKDGYWYYIVIDEVIPAGIKPLNKCKGLVISDYQSVVETNWINDLRKKYPVTVNKEALKSLVK